MDITRINNYSDARFSPKVLNQHGCFVIDNEPYEVEIISDTSAVVRGKNRAFYGELIDDFRFYSPHITEFYDGSSSLIVSFRKAEIFEVALDDIQPSQFYVSEEKVAAIKTFIHKPEDIIIQVLPHCGRYISLDGHTRLYYAHICGYASVRAVIAESDSYIFGFVEEAKRRGIKSPRDLVLLSQEDYEEKWNGFCNRFFEENG